MDVESTLVQIATLRAGFKKRAAEIAADLAREREERLSVERGVIEALVARAVASGATMSQVKKAYGTKDHRTIKDIVDAHQDQIQELQEEIASAATERATDWFEIDFDARTVTVSLNEETVEFRIFAMEDGVIMLDTDETTPLASRLDGKVESESEEVHAIGEAYRSREA